MFGLDFLSSIFPAKKEIHLTKDQAAELLRNDPVLLKNLEKAYAEYAKTSVGNGLFDVSAKQASEAVRMAQDDAEKEKDTDTKELVHRIVDELVATVRGRITDGKPVTSEEINKLPTEVRPQLAGNLVARDIADEMPSMAVLNSWNMWQKTHNKAYYELFRRGLDILDLDPVIYEMLGRNPNSMSHWLPALETAVSSDGFFKIPQTTVVKVPMPILQLSRLDYGSLTPTTLAIVDAWAMDVFNLDITKSYFIKTGIFSSKYDFRNAKVTGEKEVQELGEYLLFIQHQAVMMAGPLTQPSFYGVATTNEWVVREFIEDVEDNPYIYKGLPLHTEYRVFIDCDTDEVLGVSPYWRPDVMKKRFDAEPANPDMNHDYIVFSAYEPVLMKRYYDNVEKVVEHVNRLLPNLNLKGQWSLDIMQNGSDFWAIDMALADQSALSDCVPAGKLKKSPELWLHD